MTTFFKFEKNTISYLDEGSGPAVFLLHGYLGNAGIWNATAAFLAEKGYRIIRPEIPGFGDCPAVSEYSLEDIAALFLGLAEELGLKKVPVIGHSLGGYIAAEMALQKPDLLAGIGFFHSHPFGDEPEKRAVREKAVQFIGRHDGALFVEELYPRLFGPDFLKNNSQTVDSLVTAAKNLTDEALIAGYRAMMNRQDRSDSVANLPFPVMVVHGRHDTAVSLEQSAKTALLPHVCSFHILEKTGHMGMLEQTDESAGLLLDFLRLA